jgi:hypothetical protein
MHVRWDECLVPTKEKEGLIMCYKYWYTQKMLSEEDEARKRTREVIEKAKTAKPAPRTSEPVTSEKEKEAETVPA